MLELRIDSLTLNYGRLQGGSLKRPNRLRYNREMKFFFFFWLPEIIINIPIGDAHPPNTVSPVRLFWRINSLHLRSQSSTNKPTPHTKQGGRGTTIAESSIYFDRNRPGYRSPNKDRSSTPTGNTLFILRVFLLFLVEQTPKFKCVHGIFSFDGLKTMN